MSEVEGVCCRAARAEEREACCRALCWLCAGEHLGAIRRVTAARRHGDPVLGWWHEFFYDDGVARAAECDASRLRDRDAA